MKTGEVVKLDVLVMEHLFANVKVSRVSFLVGVVGWFCLGFGGWFWFRREGFMDICGYKMLTKPHLFWRFSEIRFEGYRCPEASGFWGFVGWGVGGWYVMHCLLSVP